MSLEECSIAENFAEVYYPLHLDVLDHEYTYFWLKGGRGSAKSSVAAIEIIFGIMNDPDANALVTRKVGNTIRTSVYEHLKWAINILGVEHLWEYSKSLLEFTYTPTGQKILCKGADEPEKLKSIKLSKGYFKFVWFEELAEYHNAKEIRNILQSVLRGGDRYIVFMTYNPPDDEHNWVNIEATKPNPDRKVLHTTYLDVPPEWNGSQFIQDAEILKANDYEAYRHEYLGEVVGNAEKLVMSGKWRIGNYEEFKNIEKAEELDGPLYGADWGFSTDPNVLTRIFIDWDATYWNEKLQKEVARPVIYVADAKYGYKTETDDLPELFDCVPDARNHVIRADSARPETISYMKRHNYPKMKGVKKWPGCVEDSIPYMRQFEWVFHPDLEEAITEAKNWSYKVNKAGDILAKLEDGYDHFWDAVRYALTPLIKHYLDMKGELVMISTTGGDMGEVAI